MKERTLPIIAVVTTAACNPAQKELLDAAKAVGVFCGKHDLAAHFGDYTFVCLVQRSADAPLLCETLAAILIRHRTYMDSFGMDSFCVTGLPCDGQILDALYAVCCREIDRQKAQIERRRLLTRYRDMLKLCIMEIAEKCGYLDYKYFQRQFTAQQGMTAGQFRTAVQ